ncbi:MAG: cupin domain-containing protein, partial [Chloroflexota bacterium]|nr:cupin domain-containing protein [Chloroflexota bacterium]
MAETDDAIFNSRNGERMRFERDATGALLRIETTNPPHPAEPEHTHPQQESSVEVLSGVLHFSVRGAVRAVGAGERIVIPPNTPHTFWNEGKEEARAIQEFRPALRTEDFFRHLLRPGARRETGREGHALAPPTRGARHRV